MIKPRTRQAGEGIDDAYNAGIIDDYQRVNRIMVHGLSRLNDLGVFVDGLGIAGHNVRNRRREEGLPKTLHRAADIAVGDDTDEAVVLIYNDTHAQFAVGDNLNRLFHRHFRCEERQVLLDHNIFHFRQQFASEIASGMEHCEVGRLEMCSFYEGTSECVTERQRDGRRGCRHEVERIRFALYGYIQMPRARTD